MAESQEIILSTQKALLLQNKKDMRDNLVWLAGPEGQKNQRSVSPDTQG